MISIAARGSWLAALSPDGHAVLGEAAARYLRTQRFFRRGASPGPAVVEDVFPAPDGSSALVVVRCGGDTRYTLPLSFVEGEPKAEAVASLTVRAADGSTREGALVDAATLPALGRFLVGLVAPGGAVSGAAGRLVGTPLLDAARRLGSEQNISPLKVEQSHSMLRVGEHAVAKLLRALDPGDDTELEVGTFLATAAQRAPVPALLGWLRHETPAGAATVLVVSEHVTNEGTAFERLRQELAPLLASGAGIPEALSARTALLARRTAELHRALASDPADPAFSPVPFDAAHAGALARAGQRLLADVARACTAAAPDSAEARGAADLLSAARPRIEARLAPVTAPPGLARIRCHGDYHLGQVLSAGTDFRIVDLGGEPLRSVAERREKHCVLRDVAGMLRSFDYAVETASRDLGGESPTPAASRRLRSELETSFLDAYLDAMRGTALVPAARPDVERLVAFYALEKCLYELSYELAQRPAWLSVPLAALERLSA